MSELPSSKAVFEQHGTEATGMAECIEREAAYREICTDDTLSGFEKAYCCEIIKAIPSEDVAPVRHGRWLFITKGQMTSAWCCSECSRTVVITCDEELRQSKLEKEYPFCHCGAKMDLEV